MLMSQKFKKFSPEGYLTGQLLVSLPHMPDTRFTHAVIFMCGHDEQGAMGLVLNKIIDTLSFTDLLKQLKIKPSTQTPSLPIFYGGPVEMGRGFVLHSADFMSDLSIMISKDFVLSATLDVIEAIAQGKGPQNKFLALGYAGWSAGQLEKELLNNNWLQVPADPKLVFSTNRQNLWKETFSKIGIDPEHLILDVGHA